MPDFLSTATFTVVDVETANEDVSSICQVGIAHFAGGELAGRWSSLVDPQDDFSPLNVAIHGIRPEHVRGKPTLKQLAGEIREQPSGQLVVVEAAFEVVDHDAGDAEPAREVTFGDAQRQAPAPGVAPSAAASHRGS